MEFIKEEHTLFNLTAEDLMISSEKVAHVQMNNPLEHALLILVKSGYSAVPVLDSKYRFKGIIGKGMILNEILGIERFETENLSTTIVEDAMRTDIPCLEKSADFFTCLKALIDHSFVCIVDQEHYFDGIVTRRAVLKHMNQYFYVNKDIFKLN
ncbi:CBS domain-containing protein [Amphibacillus sp. MSJ-3]|uniref:cyclic-di-AMP-binding protein CbpB n=1 Tax=Amphibacillus sp. MSJ-3 TaxID=2841505 RepID=UPI001C0EFFD0|nr:cyclic-di-AMP-binding protein CbpB [Amphibacillus sp. MSJ-3]MBU5595286.1 CBS domain-containing protein [Amphibacillus sp. MSJ-3]